MQLCNLRLPKCYGCGTFLQPNTYANNVTTENPGNLVFALDTLREYKEEWQIKFPQYPPNDYIKLHNQDPYACLRKKFSFHVEAVKLHDQALQRMLQRFCMIAGWYIHF